MELGNLAQLIAQLLSESQSLRDQIDRENLNNLDLTQRLNTYELTVAELEMAATEASAVREALEQRVEEVVAQLTTVEKEKIQSEVQESEAYQANESEKSYKLAQGRIEDLEELLNDLRAQVVRKNEQIESKESQISELSERMLEFSQELLELKSAQELAASEKISLGEELRLAESKLGEMEENFAGLFQEMENLKEEREQAVCRRKEAEKEVDSLHLEKLALVCKLESVEESIEETIDSRTSELKSRLDTECKSREELEEKLKALQSEYEKQQANMVESKATGENELEERKKEISEMQQQIAKVGEDQDELKTTYDSLLLSHQALEEEFAQVKQERDCLMADGSAAAEANQTLTSRCQALESELQDTKDRYETLEGDKAEVDAKAKEFNFQFLTAKANLEAVTEELQSIQDTLTVREASFSESAEKVKRLEAEKDNLSLKYSETRCIINDLRQKIHELEKEAGIIQDLPSGSVSDELDGDPDEIVAAADSKGVLVPEMQVDNENLKKQIENLLQRKDEMCQALILDKSLYQDQLAQMKEDMEERTRDLDAATEELTKLKDNEKKLEESLQGKTEAVETLMANMEKDHAEMGKLRQSILEKDKDLEYLKLTSAQENLELAKKADALAEEMARKEDEWSALKEGLVTEISSLRFERSSEQMEYQEAVKVRKKNMEPKSSY